MFFLRLHHKSPNMGKPLLLCLSRQFFYLQQTESKDGCKCYAEFKQCFGSFFIIVILPLLHFGQQVMSLPVNRSIISKIVSFIFSGNFASGSINFLRSAIACCLFFVCQESEVADFHKAIWEHMQKETSDELICINGHGSDFILSFPIPVSESNFPV